MVSVGRCTSLNRVSRRTSPWGATADTPSNTWTLPIGLSASKGTARRPRDHATAAAIHACADDRLNPPEYCFGISDDLYMAGVAGVAGVAMAARAATTAMHTTPFRVRRDICRALGALRVKAGAALRELERWCWRHDGVRRSCTA